VVFQPPAGAADRRRRDRALRELPKGIARVALVPRGLGKTSPRPGAGEDLRLSAPVDLRVLRAFLSRERRGRGVGETLRRSRRVAGELSRYLKTLGEITRTSNAECEP